MESPQFLPDSDMSSYSMGDNQPPVFHHIEVRAASDDNVAPVDFTRSNQRRSSKSRTQKIEHGQKPPPMLFNPDQDAEFRYEDAPKSSRRESVS